MCLQEINEQCAVPNNKSFVYDVLRLVAISRYGMVEAELVSIMKIYSQIPYDCLCLLKASSERCSYCYCCFSFLHNSYYALYGFVLIHSWSSLFASLGDIINYHDGLINFSNSMFKDVCGLIIITSLILI
jgi:hypothetical protein